VKSPTASAVISLAVKLEEDSAAFYEQLAERWADISEIFTSFSTQNKKNKTAVQRSYYGVISDALEGCFAFTDLDTEDYLINTNLSRDESYADCLHRATEIEDRIIAFYLDAAKPAKSLLADVPRTFERIASKRKERLLKLKELFLDAS
jgi:rubrerythrin